MRRRTLLLALGISALGAGVLLAIVWGAYWPSPSAPLQFATDLAAPLPAEAEADLATNMPVIDELRGHHGSLLDGSLLEALAAPERPRENSYVEMLRREARRLDGLAADEEDSGQYNAADNLRSEAHQLRLKAREAGEPVVQFSSHPLHR